MFWQNWHKLHWKCSNQICLFLKNKLNKLLTNYLLKTRKKSDHGDGFTLVKITGWEYKMTLKTPNSVKCLYKHIQSKL